MMNCFVNMMMLCVLCCASSAQARDVGNTTESGSSTAVHASGETSDITIRKNTAEVDLLVTVLDQEHRPIMNLETSNFTILDSGAPVSSLLDFRKNADSPLRLGMLIDRSDSVQGQFELQKQAALTFIHRALRNPDDRFFVGSFDTRVDLGRPLTNDAAALLTAADSVQKSITAGGLTALYDALYAAAAKMDCERDSIRVRKALILFSDGEDTISLRGMDETIAIAQRAGVSVYPISVKRRGRSAGDPILQALAKQTGGRAFLNVEPVQLNDVLGEIEQELRAQYLIIFRPQKHGASGGFHSLNVSVDIPGASACYRSGYFEASYRR